MTLPHSKPSMFLFAAVILVSLVSGSPLFGSAVSASPSRLDCRTVAIAAPAEGATLLGAAEIRGQALVSNFQFYKVEYSPVEREQWVLIGVDVVRTPIQNGLLVTWQTEIVREGEYRLRLRVVDVTGNYCEALVSSVSVARIQSTETVMELTETPVLTAVPPQPTFTPLLKPTLEVAPIVGRSAPIPTRVQTISLPEVNSSGLVAFFISGMLVMLSTLLFVGLFLFVRRWR